MSTAKHIGRIGALAVALGVGMATAAPTASAADAPPPDTTALIVCGTTCPKSDAANGEIIMNQFIAPTHPGQNIDKPIAVTTPDEAWPLTGALRVTRARARGSQGSWGPGGPAWPDRAVVETVGAVRPHRRSVDRGRGRRSGGRRWRRADPNDRMVIYGYSQGAIVVEQGEGKARRAVPREPKRRPISTSCWQVTSIVPNGGFGARFPGLYISDPRLDLTTAPSRPTPSSTRPSSTRQYDGFADFPLYPLNFVADLNAVLGFFYVHT